MFRFAYPWVLAIFLFLLMTVLLWRWFFYKEPVYRYPYTALFKKRNLLSNFRWRFLLIRSLYIIILLLLALSTARPQQVDKKTIINIDGIDIMLVLDVSGSMNLFDDPHDRRSRLTVAQEEAVKFINKRDNDPIGLVLFGAAAVSRCPLTLDKKLLSSLIHDMSLSRINPDGTLLATGMGMALQRLRASTAKSKIMIVLTDGAPSPGDLDPSIVVDLAKKLGIKIYTIGIGSERGGYLEHPAYGIVQVPTPINKELLNYFSHETGGQFFYAKNPHDVEEIYNTIDQLEKTEHTTPLFSHYYELYSYAALPALVLFLLLILLAFWWGIVL